MYPCISVICNASEATLLKGTDYPKLGPAYLYYVCALGYTHTEL